MSQKRVQKELDNCIKWIAAEHSYLKSLKEDILKLKSNCEKALGKEEIKDIKRAFSDFRLLAKSARRNYYYSKQMEGELLELIYSAVQNSKFSKTYLYFKENKFPPNINIDERYHFLNKFMIELRILHQKNIYFSSRFEGVLHEDLEVIEILIRKKKDPKIKIQELLTQLNEFEAWLAAIVVNSKKAGKIALELVQQHMPDYALKIKAAESLPKVDYTHKFGKYRIRILIRFKSDYNPQESAELLELFQHIAQELVDPAQQSLFGHKVSESYEFLKKRLKDNIFRNVKNFHNYALDILLKTIIQTIEHNPEMMICPSMTFIVTIYGKETTTWNRATAFCPGRENLGLNLKEIYIGSLRILSDVFYCQNLSTSIEPDIANRIYGISGDLPSGTNVPAITNIESRRIVYNNYSAPLSEIIFHELTHATDYQANLKATNNHIENIFPNITKRIYGDNLIVPNEYLHYLGELFTRGSVEALAIFSEKFIKISNNKYREGSLIHTAPLKESTKNVIVNFTAIMDSLTAHAGQQLSLFDKKYAYQPKIEVYDMAYIFNMVVLIDYIYRVNVPTFIIAKEDIEAVAPHKFPISYLYLRGLQKQPIADRLERGSLDEQQPQYHAVTKSEFL